MNSRSQLLEYNGNHIILDAYNANPSSMQMAIENFVALPANKKVLMLGAMAEMGAAAMVEHQHLINQIKKHNWLAVVLVGKDFAPYANEFIVYPTADEARLWLEKQHYNDVHILIKGSRSSRMEQIIH